MAHLRVRAFHQQRPHRWQLGVAHPAIADALSINRAEVGLLITAIPFGDCSSRHRIAVATGKVWVEPRTLMIGLIVVAVATVATISGLLGPTVIGVLGQVFCLPQAFVVVAALALVAVLVTPAARPPRTA